MSEQANGLNDVKTCTKCHETKPLSEFNIRRDTGKYRNECKACRYKARQDYYRENKQKLSDYNKNYREQNADHIKEKSKEYYEKNRERVLEKQRTYYKANTDAVIAYQQAYRATHQDEISEQHKKYWQEHKDERKAYKDNYYKENHDKILAKKKDDYYADHEKYLERNRANYHKHKEKRAEWRQAYYNENRAEIVKRHTAYAIKRLANDPIFKLKEQTRTLIRNSFKRTGYKKGTKTEQILGCDFDTFVDYLLGTWRANYGTEWNGEPYHIDHITPLATAKTEQDVIELCHYTNLQLLKPEDNQAKSDSLEWQLNKGGSDE